MQRAAGRLSKLEAKWLRLPSTHSYIILYTIRPILDRKRVRPGPTCYMLDNLCGSKLIAFEAFNLLMAIPPQLACKLSDHAAAVQDFCNMAPGVAWTNQMLDDMLEGFAESSVHTEMTFTPPVRGLTKISVWLIKTQRKVKKDVMKNEIRATVHYYCGRNGPFGSEDSNNLSKLVDFDRAGLKDAICFLQRQVQNVKRRGLCEKCLTGERPSKRLRVADTNLCSNCLMNKALF